jgi:hypothetical protein
MSVERIFAQYRTLQQLQYSSIMSLPFINAVRTAFSLHVYLCDIIGDSVSCLWVKQLKYLTSILGIGWGNDVITARFIFPFTNLIHYH